MADFDALTLKIKADIRDMANKLSTATGKVRTFSQGAGKHAKAVGRSFAEMGSRISGGLKTAGQGMTSAGRSIGVMGAAVTGGIGLMARSFASFEDGLKNIEILLGGDKEAMAAIEAQIRSMAVETGVSRNIMTKAFFDVQSATGDATVAMGMFESAVKLAEAGGSSLEDSTSGLLTLMESYGDSLEGAADGADLLFKTQVQARASVGELAQAAGMFIPTAKEMGVSAEDAMAAFAKMSLALGDANRSSTAMAAVLTALKSPTEDMIVQMDDWFQMSSQRAVSEGKFLEIMKKLGTVEAERLTKLIPNIRAGKGLAAITNDYNTVLKNSIDLKIRAGIVDENFRLQQQKLSTQLGRMKQSWLDLSDAMLAPLVPMIKEVAGETIPEMTKGIKAWITDNKDLAASIAKVVGVVGVGGVGLGGMLFVLGQLSLSLISLGTAIKWTALTALPALWTAITAVAGSVAVTTLGITGLYASWSTIILVGAGVVAAYAGIAIAIVATLYQLYKNIEATNNAAKAERQRYEQQQKHMGRLTKANNDFLKTLQNVSEEDRKRVDLLNQEIQKQKELQVAIEKQIKTNDISEKQGQRLRNQTTDRLVQYADESMALENELKAKYKLIDAEEEKSKKVEVGSKVQSILNEEIKKSTISQDEYNEGLELLKQRFEAGDESAESFRIKMESLLNLTKAQSDATVKQTQARKQHTSAINRETEATSKLLRVLVSGPGAGGGRSTFISSAPAVGAAATTTREATTGGGRSTGVDVAASGFGEHTAEWPTGLGTLQRGTPFVPQTGMYQLHRGESVTPRGRNEGGGGGEITIVNVIDPSMVNGLLDKNLIINTISADIIKRGVTRRVVKGVSR